MEKLENENVSLEFQVQSSLKECENIKLEYQKLFDSIKKTRTQTQGEINELIENVNQKAYTYGDTSPTKYKDVVKNTNVIAPRMYKVHTINRQNVRTQANKSVSTSTRLKYVTSVRRPSSRGSSFKNSVLSNTKNQPKDVEIHVMTNKKKNVTSKKNVVQTKKIVTNVAVKNALKAKDIFCISRDKNVLTSCHDKCLAKYKLSVNSKVKRAYFTTPRTAKSKSLDTTHVVAKTRFAVVTLLSAKNKDSGALRSTSQLAQEHSLSKYIRTKIKTSDPKCQLCDGDLEVAFRSKTCYVRNLEGDVLLTGARASNLYTI
ncbi:hypothetical protein Tco_0866964 [Tanacetum coccineum]